MENGKINDCRECKSKSQIADYVLLKKPQVFSGSSTPKVMIIGHSPSVRTNQEATVVLNLNKNRQPLYQYITNEILQPLDIVLKEVYATNLIKCQTNKMPEDIDKKVQFFDLAFASCRSLLENEIEQIKPVLIISLSETVLKLLSRNYIGIELKMKESFGKLLTLTIKGKEYKYIPVVHLPKGENSMVRKHYFPEQLNRLMNINWR